MRASYVFAALMVLNWVPSAHADNERFHELARIDDGAGIYGRGPLVGPVQRYSDIDNHGTMPPHTGLSAKAGREG